MRKGTARIALAALAIAAVVGLGQWGHAFQAPQGPGRGGLPRLQQLTRELNITEAQRTQIRGFLDNAQTQLRALRDNTSLTPGQRLDRSIEIREQVRNQIQSILTTEQKLRAEELRKQAQERMAQRQERMQQQMLGQLVKRLDLTDAQHATIKSYMEDQRTQLRTLRDNTSLTREQRREQVRAIHEQTQSKINSALTADQQTRLNELRQQAQNRARGRMMQRRRSGPVGPLGFQGGRVF